MVGFFGRDGYLHVVLTFACWWRFDCCLLGFLVCCVCVWSWFTWVFGVGELWRCLFVDYGLVGCLLCEFCGLLDLVWVDVVWLLVVSGLLFRRVSVGFGLVCLLPFWLCV